MPADGCIALQHAAGPLGLQLAFPGLLWVSVHCAGMCGPLLAGFRFGRAGDAAGGRLALASAQVLAYQTARAALYAGFGAAAGAIGGSLADALGAAGPWLIAALAAGFLIAAIAELGWAGRLPVPGLGPLAGMVGRALARAQRSPITTAAMLGALLAFLPCMLAFWALGLAAASGSALHGALVMVALVGLTTPALWLAACTPLAAPAAWRRRIGRWVPPAAMAFSGAWLALIAAAGAGLIAHRHVGAGGYVVMLW